MTDHFKPLWARNVPKFGIAHAMALGVSLVLMVYAFLVSTVKYVMYTLTHTHTQLGPWLAVEIPDLVEKGLIKHKTDSEQKQ